MNKYYLIREELKGLDVSWGFHYSSSYQKSRVPNMAQINRFSIIWHDGAYCWREPGTVEVMKPGGDIEGHYPINKLRKLVA